MAILLADKKILMLVENKSLVKVDMSCLSRMFSLLKVPIELSSFQTLPDHEPNATNSEDCDPTSYEKDRPVETQTEALVHPITLAMQQKPLIDVLMRARKQIMPI